MKKNKKNKKSKVKKNNKITLKKKLSKKQLLDRLKKSKVKEKSLSYYKKEKDSKFRKEARNESFITVTDLNTEIRLKSKELKSKKGDIQSQKNKIKFLEKENKKITEKRKDLEEEYNFSDEDRKKEIKKLLDKPDYKKKNLFIDKNLLKALEGKDFYFVINDGFKKYKINTKELKKYWKKGKDASIPILKRIELDVKNSIKQFNKLIKKEKNTASKARMKKLKRIKSGLEDKLKHTVRKNIEALETGDTKLLDDYSDKGEKAYSLLFKVIGFNIDRIGI